MNINAHTKSIPNIGLDIIDKQHMMLVDLAKDVKNAVGVGANIRCLDALLSVLLNSSIQHFKTEEPYLRNHANQKEHCLEHYSYLTGLLNYISDIRNNKIRQNPIYPAYLEDWLHDHIDRFDRPCFSAQTATPKIIPCSVPANEGNADDQERRRHKRIPCQAVVDKEIVTQCYNPAHLNNSVAKIVDMSPGGLKLHSSSAHQIKDMLLISCTIGRNFKMKEKVKVVTAHDHHYGVEFLSPHRETVVFLTELHGAVHLNRIKHAPGSRARTGSRSFFPEIGYEIAASE